MYATCIKRLLDFLLSLTALLILSPLLLVLTVVGAVVMKGNPFFTQLRPGRKDANGEERIFRLIKFRTMTCEKDADGKLFPDEQRVTKYGRFLRSTSLDELPELLNILIGDMAIVGPRPLLPEYLPYYTAEERRRHDMRPGLTGWAQVNGRNITAWDERLQQDVYYIDNCGFLFDCKILLMTVVKTVKRSDIIVGKQHGPGHGRLDIVRQGKLGKEENRREETVNIGK